jgi:hypothetical protein
MKLQTKMAVRFGAVAFGLTLAFADFRTSAVLAQTFAVSACGTCNVLPFSWGPDCRAAITPWHDPQDIGSRMNGLYNTMLNSPLPPYVLGKLPPKYGKRKAR